MLKSENWDISAFYFHLFICFSSCTAITQSNDFGLFESINSIVIIGRSIIVMQISKQVLCGQVFSLFYP